MCVCACVRVHVCVCVCVCVRCWKQLDVLESLMLGAYVCGDQLTLADMTLFPTLVFFLFFTPRVFGWAADAVFYKRPKLRRWEIGS